MPDNILLEWLQFLHRPDGWMVGEVEYRDGPPESPLKLVVPISVDEDALSDVVERD